MHEKIYLWKEDAPYTQFSPLQAQPSVTEYAVPGSRGAVVVVPGGGYCMKADHEGAPIAEMLNQAGVSAYVLDYRVKPCHMLAPLADAKRAIRLVRSMGYEKVAILGFSAGGPSHLHRRHPVRCGRSRRGRSPGAPVLPARRVHPLLRGGVLRGVYPPGFSGIPAGPGKRRQLELVAEILQ